MRKIFSAFIILGVIFYGSLYSSRAQGILFPILAGSAPKTVPVVQHAAGASSVAYPSNNTLHNLLVMMVFDADNIQGHAISDTAGNTWTDLAIPQANLVAGYVCDAKAGANTVSLATATNALMHIWEFSGNKTTACADTKGNTVSTLNTVSTSSPNSGNVAQAKELVVAYFAAFGTSTASIVAGTGFSHGLKNSNVYAGGTTAFSEVGNVFTGLSGIQTATTTGETNSPFNVIATFELN